MVNSMIVSWIFNTIEATLRSSITNKEVALDLWEDIKQRFSITNGPRMHQLKSNLSQCRQNGEQVMQYFGRLKLLWDELAEIDKIPVCSCNGCSCNLSDAVFKRREEENLHQFLMGLDHDSFATVRSTILNFDPLPSVYKAYSMIIQEERVRKITSTDAATKPDPISLAARAGSSGSSNSRRERKDANAICSNCNKKGHLKAGCFELIGFPDWWGNRSKNDERINGGSSSQTNQQGSKKQTVKANSARTQTNSSRSEEGSAVNVPGLSQDQLKALLNLLDERNQDNNLRLSGKATNLPWIIDTGASHHMTGSLISLTEVTSMKPCPVRLPNGAATNATKQGTLDFGGRLKLKNVLFVPELDCNLISVSQLLEELGGSILYTKHVCVIQDHSSMMPIDAGKQREGLYYLSGVQRAKSFACRLETSAIWHQRLGHPSSKVIKMLPMNFKNSNDNVNCEICFRAKQTRDLFPSSENKTSECFELIHCDLWGPYRVPSSCGSSYFLTIVDDYSRAVWIFLLKEKRKVADALKYFVSMAARQFGKTVKIVRSDNGGEFICLKVYFAEQGILHQTSVAGTPQQNGCVERKHRHILNIARALRFQASLPIQFWGECILAAEYLINRTPNKLLVGKTPYEVLYVLILLVMVRFMPRLKLSHFCHLAAPEVTAPLGRGHRDRQPSSRLRDFVTYSACFGSPRDSIHQPVSSSPKYPISSFIDCSRFSPSHCAFLAAISEGKEPETFAEAVKDQKWRVAMQQEMAALEKNRTWVISDLPPGKKAIGSK